MSRRDEQNCILTLTIAVAMYSFWRLGFGMFKFPSPEVGSVSYNITVLHVFVVLAALILPVSHAMVIGLLMGALSSISWHQALNAHISPLMYANYIAPRIGIALAASSAFRVVHDWRRHEVGLLIVAFAGTLANTAGYCGLLVVRIALYSKGVSMVDPEIGKLNLTVGELAHIAGRHFPIEFAVCGGFLLALHYSRIDRPSAKRVFIGHGGSPEWRDLRNFLVDQLKLDVVEFNSSPTAGEAVHERILEMLDQATFAFLVMTSEDIHADGSCHARENVVHETGLTQGRLGFRRAIVLLEEGCAEFSNIDGIVLIVFPKGNILAKADAIRGVLEREGVI
jgi:uncharacterized membrane protein